MNVTYPLFITAKDDPMVEMIKKQEELRKYDDIDIEDGLFFGWDVNGIPVELCLEQGVVKAKQTSDKAMRDELKEAVLNYAKLAKPKVSFVSVEDNMVKLFEAVEKHINEGNFIGKVKRLFRK